MAHLTIAAPCSSLHIDSCPHASFLVFALVLAGSLVLGGCDSDGTEPPPEVAEVIIAPDSAFMEVGDRVDFSAVALTADGDTIPNLAFQWASTDPSIFTVADDGSATAQGPGTAFCGVKPADEAATKTVLVPIGLDSAFVSVSLN